MTTANSTLCGYAMLAQDDTPNSLAIRNAVRGRTRKWLAEQEGGEQAD
jgi:hypothetical protein